VDDLPPECGAATGDGRFSYRYTFERTTQSITYTFRHGDPGERCSGLSYQADRESRPGRCHVDP